MWCCGHRKYSPPTPGDALLAGAVARVWEVGAMTNLSYYVGERYTCWETPPEVFDPLDREFGFTLDVCALPHNAKCEQYYTPEQDGLSQDWQGVCWCNPPYGREIGRWVRKAYQAAQAGATVVCLLPARTDTAWWHDYAMKGEIRFIRGRVRFIGGTSSAPFPSAIVIFRPAPGGYYDDD